MAQVVPPCSAFCSEFLAACDGYIPGGLLDSVRCDKLPTEADGPGACISKPGDLSDILCDMSDFLCDMSDILCYMSDILCWIFMSSCLGCVQDLRSRGQEARVCDGTVDCPDFSDELYCDYCPEKHFHCGVGRQCIDKARMCDGRRDCDNGADERGCGE